MKRKILIVLFAVLIVLSTGCKNDKKNDTNLKPSSNEPINNSEIKNKDEDGKEDNGQQNTDKKEKESNSNVSESNNNKSSNNNSNQNNSQSGNSNNNNHPKLAKYVISFNSNGGTQVSSQTIEYGKTVSRPANPTRDNYNFDGWFVNGAKYDFTSPVHSSFTITARWSQKVYIYSKNDSDNMFNMITNYANGKGMVKSNYSNGEVLIMMVTMCTKNSKCNDHENFNVKYNKAVSDINKALATTPKGKTVKYHINTQELKNNDLSGTTNMYILRMYAYT